MKKQEVINAFIEESVQDSKNEFFKTGTIERKIMVLTINQVGQTSIVCYSFEPAMPMSYPVKLEEITDMINCFIKTTEEQGGEVISAIYVEHIAGEEKDLLFFQIKTEDKERREVIMVNKGVMHVDTDGKIQHHSEATTFVNIIK